MTRILSADWVLPVDGPAIEDGAVAIEGGRIAAVGPADEIGHGERYPGAALLPGLVNAHTHLEYAVYAGFGDGSPFDTWIGTHLARKERLAWEDMLAIARLGAAECLASGVTTVADASFSGAAAAACSELGLRATVYLEVFGSEPEGPLARFEELRERVAGAFSERVRLGISPRAPYTVAPELYEAAAGLDLPIATHLAESEAEQQYVTTGTGSWSGFSHLLAPPPGESGVSLLVRLGVLGPRVVAAHCVYVDDDEIALLAKHGAGVAHCPRSNAFLGCGIAPLAELLAAGVRVGLGTDSPASTPSFDMFDELRAAVFAARARARDPRALSAADALELATLGSARTLRLEDEVGSLTVGKQADVTVVSLAGSPYSPVEDPAAAVVFGGSPSRVIATLVAGETLYERGGSEWLEELRSNGLRARGLMLADTASVPVAEPA